MNRGLKLVATFWLFAAAIAAGQGLRALIFPVIEQFGRRSPGLGAAIVTLIAVSPLVLVIYLTRAWRKDLRILRQPDYWNSMLESGVNRVRALAISVAAATSRRAANTAKGEAFGAYQESLSQLKLDPSNPDSRQKTLRLGREYSNLTRGMRGGTPFDEVALLNDINAVCGPLGGNLTSPPFPVPVPAPLAIEDRLEKLESLKTKGLITEAEYQAKRSKVLEEI